jgi:hypothetical protein
MTSDDLTDPPPNLDGCDVCGAEHWTVCLCDPSAPHGRQPTSEELEDARNERLSRHERASWGDR